MGDLLALLPLLALAVFKLVPCLDSFDVKIDGIDVNLNSSQFDFEQSEAPKSTLTLPEDDVLDLTTLLLPGTVEEEELFPDFSVLGSFNFSTPSASLFLQGHFLKYTFIKFSYSG